MARSGLGLGHGPWRGVDQGPGRRGNAGSGRLQRWSVDPMVKKHEFTSAAVASKAAKVLRDPKASKDEKSAAASALTQARDQKPASHKKKQK